jgi:hypothetical protein
VAAAQSTVAAPVVGSTKPTNLTDAAAALDISIDNDDIAALEESYTPSDRRALIRQSRAVDQCTRFISRNRLCRFPYPAGPMGRSRHSRRLNARKR